MPVIAFDIVWRSVTVSTVAGPQMVLRLSEATMRLIATLSPEHYRFEFHQEDVTHE